MRAVGLFGGTFDPIHIGHLITAQSVLEIRNLSKILFMPAFVSPLKVDYISASSEDRTKMVELAIKDNPNFELDKYEINKARISFTIDTLKDLKKKYSAIELIIGYDNFLVFDKWKKSDEILELAKVVVLQRRVEEYTLSKSDNRFVFVDNPTIDLNSTDIRERIRKKMNVEFLLPPLVKEYINHNNLYTGDRW